MTPGGTFFGVFCSWSFFSPFPHWKLLTTPASAFFSKCFQSIFICRFTILSLHRYLGDLRSRWCRFHLCSFHFFCQWARDLLLPKETSSAAVWCCSLWGSWILQWWALHCAPLPTASSTSGPTDTPHTASSSEHSKLQSLCVTASGHSFRHAGFMLLQETSLQVLLIRVMQWRMQEMIFPELLKGHLAVLRLFQKTAGIELWCRVFWN